MLGPRISPHATDDVRGLGKDIKVRPELPVANNEMLVEFKYEVIQADCDLDLYGARDLTPEREFRGLIGTGAGEEATVPAQTIGELTAHLPTIADTKTVTLNKSPLVIQSRKPGDAWPGIIDHSFATDMSTGPMVTLGKGEILHVEYHHITGKIVSTDYRIEVRYQTPAPELLQSDVDDGYTDSHRFKYKVEGVLHFPPAAAGSTTLLEICGCGTSMATSGDVHQRACAR